MTSQKHSDSIYSVRFSNGCKPVIVLTEIQIFGTELNPVHWIRASRQHNNRSVLKQHPCNIQTQCVRRVWDENAHNIGENCYYRNIIQHIMQQVTFNSCWNCKLFES